MLCGRREHVVIILCKRFHVTCRSVNFFFFMPLVIHLRRRYRCMSVNLNLSLGSRSTRFRRPISVLFRPFIVGHRFNGYLVRNV